MAKKTNNQHVALIDSFTPNALTLKIDGEEVKVAADSGENDFMQKVIACHIRHVFQKGMKRYAEDDVKFSPKEIKDLVEAAAAINKLCGEAYAKEAVVEVMKQVESEPIQAIDFSSISKPATPANDHPAGQ